LKEAIMKTIHHHLSGMLALVLVGAALFTVNTAEAQKKKKEAAPEAAVAQTVPQTAMKSPGNTIREVLSGLQGKATNLGTLTKLAGDYVVFDNEGDTIMYPLSALQSVRMLKAEEEGGEKRIEIRFLNKD
jgi:hypothetical protein